MKFNKIVLLVLILCAGFLLLKADVPGQQDCIPCESEQDLWGPEGCTVVIVGKNASVDGSVMSTHTCDCGMCDWTFRVVSPADHELESKRKIYHVSQYKTWPPEEGLKWEIYKNDFTGVEIPQVPHTYGYIHGMFGYMNDQQLGIGESTIGCHRKMNNRTPSAVLDLTALTMLAMERCKTAREAIKTMGSLAEKYGYGFHDGGEMLAVSDPQEIWIFEIMPVGPLWTPESGKPGAIWCAQRVPDDHVSVCPNESRIGEIDLNNKNFFMASSNVKSFAIEQKFYDPESGEPFNWKKAYSPSDTSAASSGGSRARMWRFFDLVAPSQQFSPDTPNMNFPFSVKPDKKLSVKDVMNITRDKYQGTPYDPAAGLRGGPFGNPNYHPRPVTADGNTYPTPRTIGVNRAEYTTITQCRDWLPAPIGGIVWIAFGAQDTACYMPFYAGVTEIPYSFQIGDHWVFNRESARWASDYVDFHTQVAYSHAIEDVKKALEKWEDTAIARVSAIDLAAQTLLKQDPKIAIDFITDYSNHNANKVVKAWWKLGDDLLVRYNHLGIYNTETRRNQNLPYPEWWVKELVKYHDLKPREQRR